jgi:hypothetical protein
MVLEFRQSNDAAMSIHKGLGSTQIDCSIYLIHLVPCAAIDPMTCISCSPILGPFLLQGSGHLALFLDPGQFSGIEQGFEKNVLQAEAGGEHGV